jgi:K+-transporting ATPase KdpF subunit
MSALDLVGLLLALALMAYLFFALVRGEDL